MYIHRFIRSLFPVWANSTYLSRGQRVLSQFDAAAQVWYITWNKNRMAAWFYSVKRFMIPGSTQSCLCTDDSLVHFTSVFTERHCQTETRSKCEISTCKIYQNISHWLWWYGCHSPKDTTTSQFFGKELEVLKLITRGLGLNFCSTGIAKMNRDWTWIGWTNR